MAKKVLIVDDEEVCRKIYQRVLRDKYELCAASNGREALEKLASEEPDGILLNAAMPEMNGIDALREIRKTNPYKPVIMSSGDNLDGSYQDGATLREILTQAGATDFFPVTRGKDLLSQLFERYLDLRILVSVQDALVIRMVERVFDGKYTFDIADSTGEARERLDSSALVIAGIGNPAYEARGIAFIQHVMQEHPDKPLVVMSGYDAHDGVDRSKLADYIALPCLPVEIAERIEKIIGKEKIIL